jgi:hypothetical protein
MFFPMSTAGDLLTLWRLYCIGGLVGLFIFDLSLTLARSMSLARKILTILVSAGRNVSSQSCRPSQRLISSPISSCFALNSSASSSVVGMPEPKSFWAHVSAARLWTSGVTYAFLRLGGTDLRLHILDPLLHLIWAGWKLTLAYTICTTASRHRGSRVIVQCVFEVGSVCT